MRTVLLVLIAFGLGIGAAHVPWRDILRGGPKPLTDAESNDPVGAWAGPLLTPDTEGLLTYRGYVAWRFERDGVLFVREVRDDDPSAPRAVAGRWQSDGRGLRVRVGDSTEEASVLRIGSLSPDGARAPGVPAMTVLEPTLLVPSVQFEGSGGRTSSTAYLTVTRFDGDGDAFTRRWAGDLNRLREQERARR